MVSDRILRGDPCQLSGFRKLPKVPTSSRNNFQIWSTPSRQSHTKGNVNPYTGEPGTKDEGINRNGTKSASDYFQPKEMRDAQARQSSRLEAWGQLRSTMTKDEIRVLLGEPNLKTERKWVYANAGAVSFEANGIKWETFQK